MISHKHQCIFIHIPKCAGTSISTALGHFDDYTGRGGQDHRTIRMIEAPLKLSYLCSSKDYFAEMLQRGIYRFRGQLNSKNKFTVTSEQYRSYFKFTFVRNPWSRAYSWYRNVMEDEKHRENNRIKEQLSFKTFLKKFIGRNELRPQIYWLQDYRGNLPFDFIGRFENLHEDFRKVCDYLKIEARQLPHRNPWVGENYQDAYDQGSIDLVNSVYREEIERFGYSF